MSSAIEQALKVVGADSPEQVDYEVLVDRLADLLRLAEAAGFDLDEVTDRARMHAHAEIVMADEMAIHDANQQNP